MRLRIAIPRVVLPEFTIKRGLLLNISIFGIGLVVPPVDITFWKEMELIPEIVVFDSLWIWEWGAKMLSANVDAVIKAMEEEAK